MTTYERAVAWARAKKSRATTRKGIIRYALANRPRPQRFGLGLNRTRRQMAVEAWQESQRLRRRWSEAKRAKNDKQFRRTWLAKLRRQEDELSLLPTEYEPLCGALQESESRAQLARDYSTQRAIAGVRPRQVVLPRTALVGGVFNVVGAVGYKPICRGKSWGCFPTEKASYFHHRYGETEWRNSRAVGYTRAVNDNYIRSVAVLRSDRHVSYLIHNRLRELVLPDGYSWIIDELGLAFVYGEDNFHPEASDLLSADWFELCRTSLLRLASVRKQAQVIEEQIRSDLADVWVCVADSYAAGNCVAGTARWASQHGMQIDRHYPAVDLIQESDRRVRAVLWRATKRHKQELARGYCNLLEHGIECRQLETVQ